MKKMTNEMKAILLFWAFAIAVCIVTWFAIFWGLAWLIRSTVA